jgi:hypothetical protein
LGVELVDCELARVQHSQGEEVVGVGNESPDGHLQNRSIEVLFVDQVLHCERSETAVTGDRPLKSGLVGA